MSYEGYDEFLCENGHHWCVDASVFLYGSHEERKASHVCPVCKSKAKYTCEVDETNGYDADYPITSAGPKTEIGFDDVWREDHYGNKYATKILRFAPVLEPSVGKKYKFCTKTERPVVSGTFTVERWREIKESAE